MLNSPTSPQHKGFPSSGGTGHKNHYKTPTEEDVVAPIQKTLVWHRIASNGFKPAAREGHSSVSTDGKVYIFGGVETGRRVNTTQVLDVPNGSWAAHAVGNRHLETEAEVVLDASSQDDVLIHQGVGVAANDSTSVVSTATAHTYGNGGSGGSASSSDMHIPTPRSQHAACIVRHLQVVDGAAGVPATSNSGSGSNGTRNCERQWMIIHGGEGVAAHARTHTHSTNANANANGAASFGPKPNSAAAATTAVVHGSTSKTVGFADTGISPGDSLQQMSHKTGGIRVATALEQRRNTAAAAAAAADHNHTARQHGHLPEHEHEPRQKADPLQTQELVTYDDLYALDLSSGQWTRLQTSLAPLPRRGHSMNVALINTTVYKSDRDRIGATETHAHASISSINDLYGLPSSPAKASLFGGAGFPAGANPMQHEECLLLFGGYCKENENYSNTVHVCSTRALAESLIESDRAREQTKAARIAAMDTALAPKDGDLNHGRRRPQSRAPA